MIAAIDPGLHDSGLAVFTDDGELVWAALVSAPRDLRGVDAWYAMSAALRIHLPTPLPSVTTLVIELPQVYVRSRSKGDPNDLIQLAVVVGGIVGAFRGADIVVYKPAAWKGQATKEVTKNRCLEKLNAVETSRIVLPAKSLQHNVWDAVGLGLHHLKKTRAVWAEHAEFSVGRPKRTKPATSTRAAPPNSIPDG